MSPTRGSCTTSVCIVVANLTPLCLQRDPSVLPYTLLFGICCVIFVVAFMTWSLADESYMPNGSYHETVPEDAWLDFGSLARLHLWEVSVATFVLLALLSTAFLAHYNAPKFYVQMRDRFPRRHTRAVTFAFDRLCHLHLDHGGWLLELWLRLVVLRQRHRYHEEVLPLSPLGVGQRIHERRPRGSAR